MIDPIHRVGDASVRLFFALVPDDAMLERLSAAVHELRLEAATCPVPRNNYHATLAFVGEVPTAQLPIVQAIGLQQGACKFSLTFDAYEYWPKPEVVVAAARTIPSALQRLWRDLHDALALRQWALNCKRLRPHVTLAKKAAQAPVLQAVPALEWSVKEFSLLRSDGSDQGPIYTVVDTWSLLDEMPET